MQGICYYLTSGLFLGIIAGISPGPLLPLVVSETLKFGPGAGIKLSLSPLITDVPIVLASFFLIRNYAENDIILGIISGLGAMFLLFLAWENIFYKPVSKEKIEKKTRSLQKGIVTNLLNPHPYLFWILVGAPILINASKISSLAIILFLVGFYSMLVGSKILFALLTGRMKNILQEKSFIMAIRILGIALVVFAVLLIKETVNYIL
jgi:threonine/homoserine/homoserine lactone efflux protein